MARRVFLTGATGFVGSALARRLLADGDCALVCAVRSAAASVPAAAQTVVCQDFAVSDGWQAALSGVDVVVHSAARVHVMNDTEKDPLAAFRQVNVGGTLNLARQAAAAGVRRFVFISSIKVNGEETAPGGAYRADDVPAPRDPYGVSKHEAEQQLLQLAAEGLIEVVIVRPVLVYGPGVKANFLSMMRWLDRGVALPFGAIDNRRSLVALDNLVDLVVTCLAHPAAANQVFLASDGEDLSTTQLLQRMAAALGKRACLLPVPAWLLRLGATCVGRKALSQRLCGSLVVNIDKTRQLLGWVPPVSVDAALAATARHFQDSVRK
ncbi:MULTISPECIES: UDP-glucose 4-epimerase family protein [Pseudomonas]|uniref:SDR family oxidoreductase n=1 Tax=Pseudomonas mosselii TaxID=78327 RepID=A0A5R8Z615_9PSED|nr:SDR family oxidoreductase [Pseudomonas mosselii]TLP61150.1 SDR family oxidoreductase [Pseudomonas mosselii]